MKVTLAGLERKRHNGTLAVQFNVYGAGMLADHVIAVCTSGYGFPSYGAALKGARRALARVAETGKFPNMCDRF